MSGHPALHSPRPLLLARLSMSPKRQEISLQRSQPRQMRWSGFWAGRLRSNRTPFTSIRPLW